MTYYTFGDLERKLRQMGLPSSRMTLIKYEKNNVFLKPIHRMGKMRVFTKDEFNEAIERVKSYVEGRS